MKKNLLINDSAIDIEILENNAKEITFMYEGKKYSFFKEVIANKVISSSPYYVVNGFEIKVEPRTNVRSKKTISDHGQMVAPMPGKILKILVSVGSEVIAGTPILVMEAMKMEHTIKASKNGIIEKIHFEEECQVTAGIELVTIC